MSEPTVDVLGAYDREIEALVKKVVHANKVGMFRAHIRDLHAQIRDAQERRAAVAELIEALRGARRWHLGDKYRGGDDEEQAAWRRQLAIYDEALARVGGAK